MSAAQPERRRSDRIGEEKDAVLLAGRHYGAFRCRVIDLSDGGAQLKAPLGLKMADRVSLRYDGHYARSAEVVWIDGETIGVAFLA